MGGGEKQAHGSTLGMPKGRCVSSRRRRNGSAEKIVRASKQVWIARSFPLHIGIGHEAWNEISSNGPLSETW